MDTRDTPEQAELRRAARQLARELGPATVADLDDGTRTKRLTAAVRDAGWLELRDDAGGGVPLASGVEAAILAEGLAERVADTPLMGPLLARDLARRGGIDAEAASAVAWSADLVDAARVDGPMTSTALHALDGSIDGSRAAYVLVPDGDGARVAAVAFDDGDAGGQEGADLTRTVHTIAARAPVREVGSTRALDADDLVAWNALGLALTSADLVGAMRGVLDLTVAYAAERRQFEVAVGSFQAVQHLLAEACCLVEGSHSVSLHAAWAVDDLPPHEALAAGRVAKAYCARAARSVCETAVQVHGGIGNTWDCMVHVYLRRTLLSSQWFGDDVEQLRRIADDRLGVPVEGGRDGLS